ncbi:MAG: peptide deformylase [Hyphomonas sp.]
MALIPWLRNEAFPVDRAFCHAYLTRMAIREILTVPDPRLKEVSKPVEGGVTDELRALMDDMLETMYDAPGIGLAAIQIGVPLRVIVMDLAKEDEDSQPRFFVNPEILETVEETRPYEEGCLSVPEIYDEIERPAKCLIRYLDYDGNQVEEWAEDLYAVCIQHEMDHLEGTLFIDHLSRLKRQRAIDKVKKAKLRKFREDAA